jgi:hypothetical protein
MFSNGNSFEISSGQSTSNGGSAASIGPSNCEPWYWQLLRAIQPGADPLGA